MAIFTNKEDYSLPVFSQIIQVDADNPTELMVVLERCAELLDENNQDILIRFQHDFANQSNAKDCLTFFMEFCKLLQRIFPRLYDRNNISWSDYNIMQKLYTKYPAHSSRTLSIKVTRSRGPIQSRLDTMIDEEISRQYYQSGGRSKDDPLTGRKTQPIVNPRREVIDLDYRRLAWDDDRDGFHMIMEQLWIQLVTLIGSHARIRAAKKFTEGIESKPGDKGEQIPMYWNVAPNV